MLTNLFDKENSVKVAIICVLMLSIIVFLVAIYYCIGLETLKSDYKSYYHGIITAKVGHESYLANKSIKEYKKIYPVGSVEAVVTQSHEEVIANLLSSPTWVVGGYFFSKIWGFSFNTHKWYHIAIFFLFLFCLFNFVNHWIGPIEAFLSCLFSATSGIYLLAIRGFGLSIDVLGAAILIVLCHLLILLLNAKPNSTSRSLLSLTAGIWSALCWFTGAHIVLYLPVIFVLLGLWGFYQRKSIYKKRLPFKDLIPALLFLIGFLPTLLFLAHRFWIYFNVPASYSSVLRHSFLFRPEMRTTERIVAFAPSQMIPEFFRSLSSFFLSVNPKLTFDHPNYFFPNTLRPVLESYITFFGAIGIYISFKEKKRWYGIVLCFFLAIFVLLFLIGRFKTSRVLPVMWTISIFAAVGFSNMYQYLKSRIPLIKVNLRKYFRVGICLMVLWVIFDSGLNLLYFWKDYVPQYKLKAFSIYSDKDDILKSLENANEELDKLAPLRTMVFNVSSEDKYLPVRGISDFRMTDNGLQFNLTRETDAAIYFEPLIDVSKIDLVTVDMAVTRGQRALLYWHVKLNDGTLRDWISTPNITVPDNEFHQYIFLKPEQLRGKKGTLVKLFFFPATYRGKGDPVRLKSVKLFQLTPFLSKKTIWDPFR